MNPIAHVFLLLSRPALLKPGTACIDQHPFSILVILQQDQTRIWELPLPRVQQARADQVVLPSNLLEALAVRWGPKV